MCASAGGGGSRYEDDAHIFGLSGDRSGQGFQGDMMEIVDVQGFLDQGEMVDELEAQPRSCQAVLIRLR